VALEGDAPVGFAYGFEVLRPEGFWTLLLSRTEMTESARRHGVGRELLGAFVSFARAKGHRKMWLFTDAGNEAAQRLYPEAGGDRNEGGMSYWWVFE
jgi:GNAT superfamily N-acetyltransferase